MSNPNKTLFITFEGIDGAGKTTLISALNSKLTARGFNTLCTREPGGTACAEAIRGLLKEHGSMLNVQTEALLFAAARADHVEKIIIPALKAHKTVLCDRFVDSSLAYQGYGRGGDLALIEQCNKWATQGISPDITFYLEVPETIAEQRRSNRAEEKLLFDNASQTFFEKIKSGFKEVFKKRTTVHTLDATLAPEQLAEHALQIIETMNKK